jgi:predicted transcriptional regulator
MSLGNLNDENKMFWLVKDTKQLPRPLSSVIASMGRATELRL